MNSTSAKIFLVLYFVGLALICLGFILLVPESARGHVAWLDFYVVCAVYSANYLGVTAMRCSIAGLAVRIPRLAIYLWAAPLYSLAALCVIWRGVSLALPFRLQLMIQLALAFLVCIEAAVALTGTERIRNVTVQETEKAHGIQALKDAIAQCEVSLFSPDAKYAALQPRFERFKEDARFLSPAPAARSLEGDLIHAVDAIRAIAGTHDESRIKQEVPPLLDRCEALMAQRRNFRIEYGEQG